MKEKDKVIDWLEKEMNKNGLFYFVSSYTNSNFIHCFIKADNTQFCTFFRDAIEEILEIENEKENNSI